MNLKSKLLKRLQKYASFGVIPKLLLAPFALVSILFFIVIRPVKTIKIYPVDWQLGHLLPMIHSNEFRKRESNETRLTRITFIYCLRGPIANNFALRKLRDSVWIFTGHFSWLLIYFSNIFQPLIEYHERDNRTYEFLESDPLIAFSGKEQAAGNEKINSLRPFVCLNVRDGAYTKQVRSEFKYSAFDWSLRNSDINTYSAACESLFERGFRVIRMGAVVDNLLNSSNQKFVDYPNNGMRTEFLDFYLGHECEFAISTSSGWDEIPTIFKKPLLLVNHFDFWRTLSKPCVVFPKKFINTQSQVSLGLNEIIKLNADGKTNQKKVNLNQLGIRVEDLSSEELVEAVTEMAQRVEGTFVETPEQKEMQAKLKHILSTHPKLQPSPNYYPIRAQFASCFLSRYPNFLDGLD